jgi:hypothetical protein
VRAADLEFDPSSFTSNVAADLPLRALPPTPEELSQHHAAAWPQYTRPSNSGVNQGSQLQNPGPAVGEFRWGQNPLMYTGVRYAERHFQVIVGGKHPWKGLRGEVIGDYDGPKRASKLEAWLKEWKYTKSSSAFDPRKGGEDASWKTNQDEIFVTIKEIATNKTVSGIPLKNVWHEPYVLYASLPSFLTSRFNKSARSGMQLCEALFVPPARLESRQADREHSRQREAAVPRAPTPPGPPTSEPLWTSNSLPKLPGESRSPCLF